MRIALFALIMAGVLVYATYADAISIRRLKKKNARREQREHENA